MTAFGRPHRHLRSTDSTNVRARELADAGAPSGAGGEDDLDQFHDWLQNLKR